MIWHEPLTTGELQLLLHKFKCYLSSVGRKKQNDRISNRPYRG